MKHFYCLKHSDMQWSSYFISDRDYCKSYSTLYAQKLFIAEEVKEFMECKYIADKIHIILEILAINIKEKSKNEYKA